MAKPNPSALTLSPGVVSTSGDEVERVLQALLIRRESLTALDAAGRAHSTWRLCLIDSEREYVVVEPTPDSVSRALPARPLATFVAEFGGMQIEFTTAEPQPSPHAPGSVRAGFPKLVVTRQRRAHPRARVRQDFPVLCIVPVGSGTVLNTRIMDIGEGGIGLLVDTISFVPPMGTRLAACRIEFPDTSVMLVDLEVRHARPVEFADGGRGQRWGCQFIDPTPHVRALISRFATE